MTSYSFLAPRPTIKPTEAARRAFALQQADQFDKIAASWAGRDENQAASWRDQAASLRRGL